jgi:hypothetical protein
MSKILAKYYSTQIFQYKTFEFTFSEKVDSATLVYVKDFAYENIVFDRAGEEEFIEELEELYFLLIRRINGTVFHKIIHKDTKYINIKYGIEVDDFYIGKGYLYFVTNYRLRQYDFDMCNMKIIKNFNEIYDKKALKFYKNIFLSFREKIKIFLLWQKIYSKDEKIPGIPNKIFNMIYSQLKLEYTSIEN